MIHNIRKSRYSKIIASYLAIQLIFTTIQPSNLFALTGGPSQPEFNSFTPIGTSDMVDLSSGDFNYNIPIMDVGGYPLNLAYNSGITMDQEASWVGLGWNLNVGQIARNVRGIPDDFKGDEIRYENDMRENVTVGVNFNIQPGFFGKDAPLDIGLGLGVQYNNYEGISWKPSYGLTYSISENVQLGVNVSSSTAEGPTVSPNISISKKGEQLEDMTVSTASGNLGVSFNSRKGLENMSISASGRVNEMLNASSNATTGELEYDVGETLRSGNTGGYISFNDQSYTPTKRAGLENKNFSFSGGAGVTVFGVDVQARITGYGSYQDIRNSEKDKYVPTFGYEHTEANEGLNGILDFNREKEKAYTHNTTVLPITNYTYDIYAIQGQGAGGQFRPFRSQTSYVYDQKITDYGMGGSFGIEADVGNLVHTGFDIKVSPSTSYTSKWEDKNFALPRFIETENDKNDIVYEPVYFQTIAELGLDTEPEIYNSKLYKNKPIKIGLGGSRYNRKALAEFSVKTINDGSNGTIAGTANYEKHDINSTIKRTIRKSRNQSIHKVTNAEAEYDNLIVNRANEFDNPHHTAGIKVLKPDGSTYVFGNTAYNTKKVEATFDMSGVGNESIDCATGIISNVGANTPQNDGGDPRRINDNLNSDAFLNRITTPEYVHTYLLSSVLSSDYEDIDGNGPSLNDLGAYTTFSYKTADDNYKWRIPYDVNEASYNEGLKSKNNDQKGNYLYGEKELVYIDKIETKTHVAVFRLKNREDGRGARGETANVSEPGYQRAIDKIYLLSRPEFEPYRDQINNINDDNAPVYEDLEKIAIKVAHFDYSYILCPGVPNNLNGGGKLTLEKVYFTYRGSNMGMYTPYKFNYEKDFDGDAIIDNNEPYNLKGYDVWGNYKTNSPSAGCEANAPITAAEFPYTDQTKALADKNAKQWTLTSIDLPSGGKLEIETEADDYQYVQNKKVMQMFNVTGAGDTNNPSDAQLNNTVLYNGANHAEYIYVKLSDESIENITDQDLLDNYIGDQIGEAIQFRMLLNMTNKGWQYDYVTGYFEFDNSLDFKVIKPDSGGTFAALPVKKIKKEGGFINSNALVNPISKAGWYFGRTYLNREVYSLGGASTNTKFIDIVGDLVSSLGSVFEIFPGPNGRLQDKGCARLFNPEKSWVRLLNPTKRKLGGGLRVTKIQMYDNWGAMTDNPTDVLYNQFYGQEYNYNNEDGNTSGVATFEPTSSKENPFIEPVFDEQNNNLRDKITAPKESNYTEKPIGESFFPLPTVTYGRVEVKNLKRVKTVDDTDIILKKHATGKVVNEFYTSFDFPTITDYTDINPKYPDNASKLSSIFNIYVRNHYTLSQGFVVETNDMNGKLKRQRVYAEDQNSAISGVDYNYSVNEDGTLNNVLPTINNKGIVDNTHLLGVHYDVVNDFRENYSKSETFGVNTNFTAFLVGIFPGFVVLPVPQYAFHEDILRTAVTTKVIHKTGILKEKIAYDLGASVSTENIAWDAKTGNVLLTKTINEYDNSYYNFTYPAYWYYKGMDLASTNLGLEGFLLSTEKTDGSFNIRSLTSATNLTSNLPLYPGDMLYTLYEEALEENEKKHELLWVAEVTDDEVKFMDKDGNLINHECSPFTKNGQVYFKVVRSGYKNQQMASMSSVTSQINPIDIDNDAHLPSGEYNNLSDTSFNTNETINSNIINSSAVRYNEYWKPQDQFGLPRLSTAVDGQFNEAINNVVNNSPNVEATAYGFNPYIYNVRGEWRAIESYAYLTNRNSNIVNAGNDPNLKDDGYFTAFEPFYKLNGTNWEVNNTNWTTASTVTQYSPYGAELENKDALNRYSSAIYGYGYTLPTAVASNNKYSEIAFDGFEDGNNNAPLNETSALVDDVNFVTGEITYFNRDHFSFNTLTEDTTGNGEVSAEESHTGTQSYKVTGDQVKVTRDLTELEHEFNPPLCLEEGELPQIKYLDTDLSLIVDPNQVDDHDSSYADILDSNGQVIGNSSYMGGNAIRQFEIQISADAIEDLATMDRTFLFVNIKNELDFPICGQDNPQDPQNPQNGFTNALSTVVELEDLNNPNNDSSVINVLECDIFSSETNDFIRENNTSQLIELTFPDTPIDNEDLLMKINLKLTIDYLLEVETYDAPVGLEFDSIVEFRFLDEYGRVQSNLPFNDTRFTVDLDGVTP
ncbi:hypothetical protein [Hyunsoonleella ulvae]|uniref:hypothetical protein n=1 Tax=Hyunsoonleella ulvae TaxID=2799948 RepID=UPI0019393348|nr:hypothetical protein [Hyunsoonleella ulvae]